MRKLLDWKALLTSLCGVFMVVGMILPTSVFPYLSVLAGSYFALGAAWRSLKERSLDVNMLMVIAAAGAVAVGHPMEAAILLFLFSLSSTLESFAMARTRSAIEGLVKLRPTEAIRIDATGERRVPVSSLQPGDRVRVLAFESVPIDGEVVSGSSSIDQSAMTGESEPVPKLSGDLVFAGTQNLEGMLVVQVTAPSGATTLDRIVELVREAQENKASGERISDWFGQRYTYFVLSAAAASLLIRYLAGQASADAIYVSLTLLVALSPCAVVISTPASTLSAIAWAARQGILIRGGEFIETAGVVDLIALDKTGTLTEGKPQLVEICVCSQHVGVAVGAECMGEGACWRAGKEFSSEAASWLSLAAAVEQFSEHPLAQAIVRAARERDLSIPVATEHWSVAGMGVEAVIEGKRVRVGQRRMFDSPESPLREEVARHMESMQREGMTVALLECEGEWTAFGLRDEPRPESKALVEKVRSLGAKKVVMLTGDTAETARAVAAEVGIEDVHAGLMPEEKATLLRDYRQSGYRVMMVGDGINDAPSLTVADLGVAMGGLGSDIALNAADVVLMRDKLEGIDQLLRLGRSTTQIIRSNLYFATAVIVALAISTQVLGPLAPQLKTWALPLAVVGHEGSTVLVILNGLRLLSGPKR